MNENTSDKEQVVHLVDILVQNGVRYAVLSPGSRNAPLLIAFAREPRIRHFVVLDERSAAFFALGLVQQSCSPVALVCTSGTAPLNYAPAIAEAYYQQQPLIVVTADRPEEWIDQSDCQTIRQRDVFRNFVKASFQLPAEVHDEEELWYINRILYDAYNTTQRGRRGPVHINVPLREPLYGQASRKGNRMRHIIRIEPAQQLARMLNAWMASYFNSFRKVMIVAGFHPYKESLQYYLEKLSEFGNVVLLTETTSNLQVPAAIDTIDRVLATISEEEEAEFAPELLITMGGSLVSKRIKTFLRKHACMQHWNIDQSEYLVDTFKSLTTQVDIEAVCFFKALLPELKPSDSGYAARWARKKASAVRRHNEFLSQIPWSDLQAFSLLVPSLPKNICLQLGNSTPVRYAQLFQWPSFKQADCNRGTSGIDGSTSTAVGASVLYEGTTLLITGDMSFLYDSNALWNSYITPRLKIVVILNGGGGIFRFIPGPSETEELEECFETRRDVNARGFAELHGFRYFHADGATSLQHVLPAFWAETERPAILGIQTPREINAEVLKEYFQYLKINNFHA
ncbi:MAG: 2-succinyl-5-enolpyruvyl-6-hydroxy-3-cyclohexene-1-carboxylic-acid synthase [Odoribacter sp.]|nr:2-succinyl-5-enolpyruvyl-6-hydroxy-3-cyclohexene-1-carboxylic-acid synthase [Odoribacter sp.]